MSDVPASRTGEMGTHLQATGSVALVGAGPGDPDLLTVKAARLIGMADVIFADRLVGDGVLALLWRLCRGFRRRWALPRRRRFR